MDWEAIEWRTAEPTRVNSMAPLEEVKDVDDVEDVRTSNARTLVVSTLYSQLFADVAEENNAAHTHFWAATATDNNNEDSVSEYSDSSEEPEPAMASEDVGSDWESADEEIVTHGATATVLRGVDWRGEGVEDVIQFSDSD